MRRRAKPMYFILAVLFAVTFAFLGVGAGGNSGLDQLFSGLNIFSGGGSSVSKALKEVQKRPTDPTGFRDLATAYEAKGDTPNAITALQQYTALKPKDAKVWSELAGLQLGQAQTYVSQYQAAAQNQQLAAPSQSFRPQTGKLATALGTNPIESGRGVDREHGDAGPLPEGARSPTAARSRPTSRSSSSSPRTRTRSSSSRRRPRRRATRPRRSPPTRPS